MAKALISLLAIAFALGLGGCAPTSSAGTVSVQPQTVPNPETTAPASPPVQAPAPAGAPNTTSKRPASIAGLWAASDGTPTKIIDERGQCSGMYYNGGKPLDIGGPASCTLSNNPSGGFYTLVVRQPPNQTSYQASFDSNGVMTLSQSGTVIVKLTRQ